MLGLAVVAVAAMGIAVALSPPDLDTRFNGAYRLDDGRLAIIVAREGETLRYRLPSGESGALRPAGDLRFEAGPGWAREEPVEVTVDFDPIDTGPPAGLEWTQGGRRQRATRLALPEIDGTIRSGDLELRARLVLPAGDGPFPAVVFVHGSGRESAVDSYYNPYLFAAHGIAGLVYDKRGTGESEGRFSQNFHLLSDDTAAAVEWLRERPEIDGRSLHLAGYSQGGWIAPLAATKVEVASLLINYGPMVPVTGEDRWGYVHALERDGFGAAALARVDALNELASAILDRGEDRWEELADGLEAAEGEPWYASVRGSDSMVGFLAATRLPWWALELYAGWMQRRDPPFIDRLYDPVPTVASLDVPSLWIFGGDDSSMPTGWSVTELERLRAAGAPIEIEIFPDAEHGILLRDEAGELLGYAPGYLPMQVEWVRRQAALGTVRSEGGG